MLNTLGVLGFPLLLLAFVVIIMVQGSSPVARFAKAGAFSPETARRPASVGVEFPETMQTPLRRGILLATGDGRYYIDLALLNRRRRRSRRVMAAAAVVVAALAIVAVAL